MFFNFIVFKTFFIKKKKEYFKRKNINGFLQNKVELNVYNYIVQQNKKNLLICRRLLAKNICNFK